MPTFKKTSIFTILALILTGCMAPGVSFGGHVSVADFGALPDDGLEDTAAIQAAIDSVASGGSVYLPPGTYDVGEGGYAWSLDIGGTTNVEIYGASRGATIIRQLPGVDPSVRLFSSQPAPVSGLTLRSLTLDGNKASQSINEQRHGLFLSAGTDIRIEDVLARNFTGDGFYLYDGNTNVSIVESQAVNNDRNGITVGGSVIGVTVTDTLLEGNASQQFDSEAGGGDIVDQVVIANSRLIATDDYALTSGGTSLEFGRGWRIVGNYIKSDGHAMRVIYAADAVVANNTIESGLGNYSGVEVYRDNENVVIAGNTIRSPNGGTNGAVSVLGTSGVKRTEHIVVSHNIINTEGGAAQTGVRLQGTKFATVIGNQFKGDGLGVSAAVFTRSTLSLDMESVVASGNTIVGFDKGVYIGVDLAGKRLERANVSGNMVIEAAVGIQFAGDMANLGEACLAINQFMSVTTEVTGTPALCVENQ